MDDYEPWLTPCDPDFDPEKCESAYALWAVKEEGEPVKFLEASITDNLDYPSGYWFFWRTISFSAPPLRPSRSAPSRRPHPRRQATCRRAIRARRPSNGDIPRRQPSQPPILV